MPALLVLKNAPQRPNVVGAKDLIIDPESAARDYRRKLHALSEGQLDRLFSNIAAYPKHLSYAEKIDAVVEQAVEAAVRILKSAFARHRPLKTGPSGYGVSYPVIYIETTKNACHLDDHHPDLEEVRIVLLHFMLGENERHTFDEIMTSCCGITNGRIKLAYNDRVGYRDIINSANPLIRRIGELFVTCLRELGKTVIRNFNEQRAFLVPPLPDWDDVVAEWFKNSTGEEF
jgi:hypothetical protein